jgi:hypothetical protein
MPGRMVHTVSMRCASRMNRWVNELRRIKTRAYVTMVITRIITTMARSWN